MKAIKRSVQKNCTLIYPVIKQHFKGTTRCDKKLMALFMGMGTTALATWDIIAIKHTFHLKRKMHIIIDVSQITLRKVIFGQFYERTVIDGWIFFVSHCVMGFRM